MEATTLQNVNALPPHIVRGQDASSPKPQTAFRRASAALLKFIPQNGEPLPGDGQKTISHRGLRNENMEKLLSTMYCKTLVLVGLVLPLAEVLVERREHSSNLQTCYLGYYIFLCTGSMLYLIWMYASMVKDRTVINIINSYRGDEEAYNTLRRRFRGPINRYGSFYLRLGAIAFGIGSMVYAGLELGRSIEAYVIECGTLSRTLPPLLRMILTIAQMQFIFLNNQNMDLCNKPLLSRFGLMHLIATNLCEWLNVIIQESKHDIEHIEHHNEDNSSHEDASYNTTTPEDCRYPTLMGSLMNDVSPFLFPCTIEYSLICAVIMLDMWMDVKRLSKNELIPSVNRLTRSGLKATHVLTVDCANAHKGLLCGVITLVATIICQILYFVFKHHNLEAAQFTIDACEMVMCHRMMGILVIDDIFGLGSKKLGVHSIRSRFVLHSQLFFLTIRTQPTSAQYLRLEMLYILSSCATLFASLKLRTASSSDTSDSYNMDSCLILLAQFGVSLYSVFRLIGLLLIEDSARGVWIEIASLLQSISQTIFIVHGRSITVRPHSTKPARQLITFLLPCNIALWTINTLVRNMATSDPQLIHLFKSWAWITVTRIAMPLAIFYRFHSTICLFEMWKNAYKSARVTRNGIGD